MATRRRAWGNTKTARTHRKTLKFHIEICQLKKTKKNKKTKTNKQNRKQKTTKSCRITILQAKIKIPTKPHKKITQCCITANRYGPLHQVTTSKSPRSMEASNKLWLIIFFTITAESSNPFFLLANKRARRIIASWIHNYFDNVMMKFMINNRTDTWKTDINNLLNWPIYNNCMEGVVYIL